MEEWLGIHHPSDSIIVSNTESPYQDLAHASALTLLKAALNMAFREGKVDSDIAWRGVQRFELRRIKKTCAEARVEPAITFHILRHTYASHYLMNGGSLEALAKQLGHADTRMTLQHYGHLADGWRAEEAVKHAPTFGMGERGVVRLRRGVAG